MRSTAAALVLGVALAGAGLAGCSSHPSNSSHAGAQTSTTKAASSASGRVGQGASSTTTGAAGSATGRQAQEALAARAAITSADLPAGWSSSGSVQTGMSQTLRSSSSQSQGSLSSLEAQLGSCLGGSAVALMSLDTPEAQTANFVSPTQTVSLSEVVNVYPSASDASEAASLFTSGRGPTCAAQAFRGYVPSGYSVTGAAGPSLGVGDRSGQLSLTVQASSGGQTASLVLAAFIAKGYLLAALSFSSRSTPPASMVDDIARGAANALAAAT